MEISWHGIFLGDEENANLPGLVNVYSLLLKMAIEIVSCPIKNGDFPVRYGKLPEGSSKKNYAMWYIQPAKPWVKDRQKADHGQSLRESSNQPINRHIWLWVCK